MAETIILSILESFPVLEFVSHAERSSKIFSASLSSRRVNREDCLELKQDGKCWDFEVVCQEKLCAFQQWEKTDVRVGKKHEWLVRGWHFQVISVMSPRCNVVLPVLLNS